MRDPGAPVAKPAGDRVFLADPKRAVDRVYADAAVIAFAAAVVSAAAAVVAAVS